MCASRQRMPIKQVVFQDRLDTWKYNEFVRMKVVRNEIIQTSCEKNAYELVADI